jgi:hypothetical protein
MTTIKCTEEISKDKRTSTGTHQCSKMINTGNHPCPQKRISFSVNRGKPVNLPVTAVSVKIAGLPRYTADFCGKPVVFTG